MRQALLALCVGLLVGGVAVAQSPLTGIVLIVEMAGSYDQLLHLLTACSVAFLVSAVLRTRPIYDALMDTEHHGPETHHGPGD